MTSNNIPYDWCGEPVSKKLANPDNKPYSHIIVTCDRCKAGHWMCSVDTERLR